MLWKLLGIFAGGLALNLTPCVYPMIPITVSFFGGRTDQDRPGQIKLVLHGLCYLMGLALTNSTLGVAAALTGGLMGAMRQNPIVLTLVAVVLVLFATSLFGLWELRLPGALTQMAGKSYTGYFGSLFMGLTLGVVATPCIGPFVLGLLTWVAGMGNPCLGFLIFFILSLGPLSVTLIFPVLPVGVALLATEQGWGLLNQFDILDWLKVFIGVLALDFVVYASTFCITPSRCSGGCTWCITRTSISI